MKALWKYTVRTSTGTIPLRTAHTHARGVKKADGFSSAQVAEDSTDFIPKTVTFSRPCAHLDAQQPWAITATLMLETPTYLVYSKQAILTFCGTNVERLSIRLSGSSIALVAKVS